MSEDMTAAQWLWPPETYVSPTCPYFADHHGMACGRPQAPKTLSWNKVQVKLCFDKNRLALHVGCHKGGGTFPAEASDLGSAACRLLRASSAASSSSSAAIAART